MHVDRIINAKASEEVKSTRSLVTAAGVRNTIDSNVSQSGFGQYSIKK